MMKTCDQIKDLILTDFLDGQMEVKAGEALEAHVQGCTACRAFLNEVKSMAVEPFQKASLQPVPWELWRNVKRGIEEEYLKPSPLEEWMDKIRGLVIFPRLVPALASLVLMLVAGSISYNVVQGQHARDKEQGEYLVSLLTPSTAAAVETGEVDTPIEHYFL